MPAILRRLVLSLALVAGGLLLPVAPAQAAVATQLTLSEADGRHWGVHFDGIGPAEPYDTITLTGRLTAEGSGLAGKTIHVYRKKFFAEDYVHLATTVTDAQGYYSYVAQVKGTTAYGTVFVGDDGYDGTSSPAAWGLGAQRDFNARVSKRDGKTFFAGRVTPGWGKRYVSLQKRTCGTCAWQHVTRTRADGMGRYAFRVHYPRSIGPRWGWRAKVVKQGAFLVSTSVVLTTYRTPARTVAR